MYIDFTAISFRLLRFSSNKFTLEVFSLDGAWRFFAADFSSRCAFLTVCSWIGCSKFVIIFSSFCVGIVQFKFILFRIYALKLRTLLRNWLFCNSKNLTKSLVLLNYICNNFLTISLKIAALSSSSLHFIYLKSFALETSSHSKIKSLFESGY